MSAGFVHLRVHSDCSFGGGVCRIGDLVEVGGVHGMTAMALTDSGTLGGALEFSRKMRGAGIKPIIGCELNVLASGDAVPGSDAPAYPLVVLVENETGYRNLCHLLSTACRMDRPGVPGIAKAMLAEYADGLIGLSGGARGEIARTLLSGDYERAQIVLGHFLVIFGLKNFYLEVEDHGLPEEDTVFDALIRLGQEDDVPLVGTNDVRYLRQEDAAAYGQLQNVLGEEISSDGYLPVAANDQYYLKSTEEMISIFMDLPELWSNGWRIAERCNFEIPLAVEGRAVPVCSRGYGMGGIAELRKICAAGIRARYGFGLDTLSLSGERRDIVARLEHELKIIDRAGRTEAFLVAWDLLKHARENGIAASPGWGDIGGSLVAYAAGITDTDPIRHGLTFECLLGAEEVPALDFGIHPGRREELIEYLRVRHGRDRVALIGTYGVFNAEELEVKGLGKLKRRMTVHNAGVVIGDRPLHDLIPLTRSAAGEIVTQYIGAECEDLGLLKLDLIGVPVLAAMQDCAEVIRKSGQPDFDIAGIPLDDPATYALLASGDTAGGFPVCESEAFVGICREYGIARFEDITALIALYRPGTMRLIPEITDRKHGRKQIRYAHPCLEPILRETYGVMLYNEQIIQAINVAAGINLGRANQIRRDLGMREKGEIAGHKVQFIEGCGDCGIGLKDARAVWREIERQAPYCSGKAHTVAQAMLAYRTAWMKRYAGETALA